MSTDKIVFSTALATRIRTGKPHFDADEASFRDELARKYKGSGGKLCAARVHPVIVKFCSKYWDEQSRRLQFETRRSYDECSREVSRREPWVFFSHVEVGEWDSYDVDLPRGSREEDDE